MFHNLPFKAHIYIYDADYMDKKPVKPTSNAIEKLYKEIYAIGDKQFQIIEELTEIKKAVNILIKAHIDSKRLNEKLAKELFK